MRVVIFGGWNQSQFTFRFFQLCLCRYDLHKCVRLTSGILIYCSVWLLTELFPYLLVNWYTHSSTDFLSWFTFLPIGVSPDLLTLWSVNLLIYLCVDLATYETTRLMISLSRGLPIELPMSWSSHEWKYWLIHPWVYLATNLPMHWPNHLLIYSSPAPPAYWCTRALIQPFTELLIHWFIHPLVNLFIDLPLHRLLNSPSPDLFIHGFTYLSNSNSSIHYTTLQFYWPINL